MTEPHADQPILTGRAMALLVATVLRGGVLIAAGVTLAGGIPYLVLHGKEVPDYHTFHGANAPLRSVGAILHGVTALDLRAIIAFGAILLIATPIARVLITFIGFALRRDWTYVVITTIVLAILFYSLLAGAAL